MTIIIFAEFVSDPIHLEEIATRWPEVASYILDYNYTFVESMSNNKRMLAEKILKEYLQDKPITRETFNEFVQVYLKAVFLLCIALSLPDPLF